MSRGACLAWHEFDSRGARLRSQGTCDNVYRISSVLATGHIVNLVVGVGIDLLNEGDIFLDTSRFKRPSATRR